MSEQQLAYSNQVSVADVPTEAREPEIALEMADLEVATGHLDQSIRHLEQRISPTLRPQGEGNPGSPEQNRQTSLGQWLQSMRIRVQNAAEYVDTIRDRCELG